MSTTDNTQDEENNLLIKAYIPSKEHTPEKLASFHDLINNHPRDRKYLTNKEYNRDFGIDRAKAEEFVALAKEKNWEVVKNNKTREISISVAKPEDSSTDNLNSLRYLNTNGDINLEADKVPEHAGGESGQKSGFVKHNIETRVGNREAIPLQDQYHGHSVLEVAEAYNFPEGDGEGHTIGIIELGGTFKKSDLKAFFAKYDVDIPKIQVSGKPTKTPYKENLEVTADIQVAGLLAPKAKLVIYYGTTILEAMKRALSDTRNTLSVISISWAGAEINYSQAELDELNNVFYEAALKGITVVGASGDNGAYNNNTFPNVNVPANFSFVLGCGGTTMEMSGNAIAAEVVWNESRPGLQIGTGGGFSQRVSLPIYQQQAVEHYLSTHPQFAPYDQQRGRSIPDIAANAADSSGYSIYFEGQWMKIGGTSLATPLWAALIARINQNLGYKLGFINSHLYQLMNTEAFHPIVQGNNNLYTGALAWNPCTGLGTPNGLRLQIGIDNLK